MCWRGQRARSPTGPILHARWSLGWLAAAGLSGLVLGNGKTAELGWKPGAVARAFSTPFPHIKQLGPDISYQRAWPILLRVMGAWGR
jgi:hypothetical protein